MRRNRIRSFLTVIFLICALSGCRSVKPGLMEVNTLTKVFEKKNLSVNFIFNNANNTALAYKLDKIKYEILPLLEKQIQIRKERANLNVTLSEKQRINDTPYIPATEKNNNIITAIEILDEFFGPSEREMETQLKEKNSELYEIEQQIKSLAKDLNLSKNISDYINFVAFRYHNFYYADEAYLKLSFLKSLQQSEPFTVMNFVTAKENEEKRADYTVWINFYGASCVETGNLTDKISYGSQTTSLIIFKIEKNGAKISTVYDQAYFFKGDRVFDMTVSKNTMAKKAIQTLLDLLEKNIN